MVTLVNILEMQNVTRFAKTDHIAGIKLFCFSWANSYYFAYLFDNTSHDGFDVLALFQVLPYGEVSLEKNRKTRLNLSVH